MTEAAPFPIFRALTQLTLDGIAMDVAKLYDMRITVANAEVIISRLLEMRRVTANACPSTPPRFGRDENVGFC